MSTIIMAAILVMITIAIPLVFISLSKINTRKRKEVNLKHFSLAGLKHGLSFSNHELFKNKIIGLDNLNQALLIYELENANAHCINMKEVNNCTLSKEYDGIDIGNDKAAKIEKNLKCIDLRISFKGNAEPTSISFYNSNVNSIYEMAELEAKAKEWETVLSKLIVKNLKARA